MKIYPNPAADFVIVEGLPAGASVKVFGMTGEILLESMESKIDVSSLSSGIYFVKAAGRTAKLVKKQ